MIKRKQVIAYRGQVTERLELLRRMGYPRTETLTLIEQAVAYAPEEEAEAAVRQLVPAVSEDDLSTFTAKALLPELPAGLPWSDLVSAPHILIEQLTPRGFEFVEDERGWTVTAPDGEYSTVQFRDQGMITTESMSLPGRGEALCRATLEAALLHAIRRTPPPDDPPAF